MPEVRLLVPVTDAEGNEHSAGEVLDVDVETAEEWRARGKVSLLTAEQAAEAAAAGGHYSDVTTRDDAAPLGPGGAAPPGPQADEDEEEEDEPKSRKGKK
jgi:hypothetical protein